MLGWGAGGGGGGGRRGETQVSASCNNLSTACLRSRVVSIPHWPLPAVRDLTRDGRWSTQISKCIQAVHCFIPEKMRTHGKHSKVTITNKTRPTLFLQLARGAALPAWCSMYVSFLWWWHIGQGCIVQGTENTRGTLSRNKRSRTHRHAIWLTMTYQQSKKCCRKAYQFLMMTIL